MGIHTLPSVRIDTTRTSQTANSTTCLWFPVTIQYVSSNQPIPMNKKPTGRPRLYDSTSDKVDAFRKRQEASGYLRKEVLVTVETWDRVIKLSKLHGVSASDAASGLLENGLQSFVEPKKPMPSDTPSYSRKMPSSVPAKSAELTNPIQDFFAKRKESLQSTAKAKGQPDKLI